MLRAGGLVVTERRGQAIYYELNTSVFEDLVQHLMGWMKPVETADGGRARSEAASSQEA